MIDLTAFRDRAVRVLVVKLSSMGDVIHATGALRALRLALPRAHLALAVEGRWAPVVRHNPHLDALIESPPRDRLSLRMLREARRSLAQSGPFDVAIDLQGNPRSAAWMYLAGAPIKVGRGGIRPGWRGSVVTGHSRHAVVICADIIRSLGIDVSDPAPEIVTSADDEGRLDTALAGQGLPATGYILLNPFSRWRSKSWPLDTAATVIRRLWDATEHTFVLTGGADDRTAAIELQARVGSRPLPSLLGRMTLGEALCCFRRPRLMITCDSGPMHAAAAFRVPVVALFGPTHPEHTGPWGHGHRVIQARRPPSHHMYRSDPTGEYMKAISAESIVTAVIEALAEAPRP
jgi:heptosyltransferase-1/heptosyltransferase-2